MSLGLTLLSAIIESGSRTYVRNLRSEFFVQEERAAFEFFIRFYQQYGRIPTGQTMYENGFELPPAEGPPAYVLDRLISRAVVNSVRSYALKFQRAYACSDGEQLRTLIVQMGSAANSSFNMRDVLTLSDAAEMAMREYAVTRDSGGALPGVTLGWQGLDDATGGAMPGEVVTWVARPNLGKSYSTAKSSLAAHAQDRKVLLVSMKMGAESMARRLIGIKAGINPDFVKRGTLSLWGEELIADTIQVTRDSPPFILVTGNLTKSTGVVDSLIQEHTPDVVYIDAQYLMQPEKKRSGMKSFELLSEVGLEIQQIALARNIPIHQSVQFNQEQFSPTKGRLCSVGDAGVVGQVSSIVISITEGEPPYEIIQRRFDMLKNRDGPLVSITINFRFDPIDFSEVLAMRPEYNTSDIDWMFNNH